MNFIKTVSSTSRPVVIFGASIIGKIILDSLDILNVKPLCFCDNDNKKYDEPFHGYKVISLKKLCTEHPDALVVIAAGRYFEEIKQQLSNACFDKIFSDADVIACIDLKNVSSSKLDKIIWHLPKVGMLSKIMDLPKNCLHLPRLNVVVTTRCTLKCKHCSSLITYYDKQSDFDTSRIINSLDRIFSAVDLIDHVELLGGETFLNKDLPLITKHLLDSGKILHIDVITNGTLVPSNEILAAFKHKRVSVVIDDYGELSKKTGALSSLLDKRGIDYRINKHWAWADLGGFESRNLTKGQLEELFVKCNFNSCSELLDGKLYRCPRSSHGTNTAAIPKYENDFIDILDMSVADEDLKKKLKTFFYKKKFIYACDHCSGNTRDSLTLTPAEQ